MLPPKINRGHRISGRGRSPRFPSNYVGAEACATCHEDQVKGFGNPHSKLALDHGGKGVTCEGCHGPGKAHVDSGGEASKIFSSPKQLQNKLLRDA